MGKEVNMTKGTQWGFEADYFTFCNCDWGCPCNFNARPTQGNCCGVGAWHIREGLFETTKLDGCKFATAYFFPGLVEQGNAVAQAYIDVLATAEQRKALDAIATGRAGGGIFEVFATLTSRWHPTKVAPIHFEVKGGRGAFRIDGIMEAESELLAYPDGTTIRPTLTLPHGIEFKTALATNAKRWWVRDEDLLAVCQNKYAAVATVQFTNQGCIG
jgi:hypothetical protein